MPIFYTTKSRAWSYRRHIASACMRPIDPQQTGVQIAQELMEEIKPFVQGVYLMSNFGRYDLVADVIGR